MALDYEKKGKVAIFTINRPDVMNAASLEVFQEFAEGLEDFANDPALYVGILTGAGDRAFCAGRDMRQSLQESESGTVGTLTADRKSFRDVEVYKPMIAAVNGYCLGAGLEMALTCDIRVAADHARFGMPEVTRGRISAGGGSQRLIRMLHWCHASEVLLTGRHIDAQRALQIGLVNEVVPLDKLMPKVMEWADVISQAAPLALQTMKEVMTKGIEMKIAEGLELERDKFRYLATTEDFVEGSRAFVEKRDPDWKGR